MQSGRLVGILVAAALAASPAWAGDPPRAARLAKDAGNQFLASKQYADAIDFYFQALEIHPEFPEAHYNLGVAFLKGYQAAGLAAYHFAAYLALKPGAEDLENVAALAAALKERAVPVTAERGRVIGVLGGRLLVSGGDWVRAGERIEVAQQGKAPSAVLLAIRVYPDCVLTQRVWDDRALEAMVPGMVAVNASDRVLSR
ncbi:MAG: tetratricopeptide repeat protein [Deferrisomatales bacterium]